MVFIQIMQEIGLPDTKSVLWLNAVASVTDKFCKVCAICLLECDITSDFLRIFSSFWGVGDR
jgi:hypothetical protein